MEPSVFVTVTNMPLEPVPVPGKTGDNEYIRGAIRGGVSVLHTRLKQSIYSKKDSFGTLCAYPFTTKKEVLRQSSALFDADIFSRCPCLLSQAALPTPGRRWRRLTDLFAINSTIIYSEEFLLFSYSVRYLLSENAPSCSHEQS